MIIGIDMGHSLSGAGTGAVGICKEVDKNREAGKRLISMLKEKGHTVINCTVDSAGSTGEQLQGIVDNANSQSLDLFVSLHLNSFNGNAYGVETYVYSGGYPGKDANKDIANSILGNLVTQVGWYNRGVKEENFFVLRETVAPAVLCELGFCDNEGDMDKWDTEKIARALFEGITNTTYTAPSAPASSNTMFRVVCGTYAIRENAIAQQEKLKNAGFNSFLVTYVK